MSNIKVWIEGLEAIEEEIGERTDALIGTLGSIKEADAQARFDVISTYKQQLRQWLHDIEQKLITLQSEPDDREDVPAEIERLEELRDRIQEHLKYA